jgi:hypothetical protein
LKIDRGQSAQVGAGRRRSAQVGASRRKSAQVGASRRKSAQVGHFQCARPKHIEKISKKKRKFFRKISLFANFDFSSVKREPLTQRRFSKRNARERRQRLSVEHARSLESFVCFPRYKTVFSVKITFPICFGFIRSYSKLLFHFLIDFEIFVFSKKRGAFVTNLRSCAFGAFP